MPIKAIVKKAPSLISKGISIGGEAYAKYKDSAAKESSLNGWLKSNFIDLEFTPSMHLLSQELKAVETKLIKHTQEQERYILALIILAALVPTFILLLTIGLIFNSRLVRNLRGGLNHANASVDELQRAVLRNGQGAVAGAGLGGGDLVPPVPLKI